MSWLIKKKFDKHIKDNFYNDFNKIVEEQKFYILTSSIYMIAYIKKYGYSSND